MEHVVFYPGAQGAPSFQRVTSRAEAVSFVEHLRNSMNITEFSVHALTPVPVSFRAYYHVEVPENGAAQIDAATIEDAPAPVEAELPIETPVAPAPQPEMMAAPVAPVVEAPAPIETMPEVVAMTAPEPVEMPAPVEPVAVVAPVAPEPIVEPVIESVAEPMAEPIAEPVAEFDLDAAWAPVMVMNADVDEDVTMPVAEAPVVAAPMMAAPIVEAPAAVAPMPVAAAEAPATPVAPAAPAAPIAPELNAAPVEMAPVEAPAAELADDDISAEWIAEATVMEPAMVAPVVTEEPPAAPVAAPVAEPVTVLPEPQTPFATAPPVTGRRREVFAKEAAPKAETEAEAGEDVVPAVPGRRSMGFFAR